MCNILGKLDVGKNINKPNTPKNCCYTTLGSAKTDFSMIFDSIFD